MASNFILLEMEERIQLYADGAELKGGELKIQEERGMKPAIAT